VGLLSGPRGGTTLVRAPGAEQMNLIEPYRSNNHTTHSIAQAGLIAVYCAAQNHLIVELMNDPEIPPPDVSPQLANVQNSIYSVIENSKKQQWTITNYVILVYAAIFGLSQALKPLGIIERWGLWIIGCSSRGLRNFPTHSNPKRPWAVSRAVG